MVCGNSFKLPLTVGDKDNGAKRIPFSGGVCIRNEAPVGVGVVVVLVVAKLYIKKSGTYRSSSGANS